MKVRFDVPRCPTCFRRCRRRPHMDAYACPARRCPLGYVVCSLDLYNRAFRRAA